MTGVFPAIAVLLFALIALYWAKGRKYAAYQHDKLMDAFFVTAHKLADDARTPAPMLEVMALLGDALRSRTLMPRLFWHALTGKLRQLVEHPGERHKILQEAVRTAPPAIAGLYFQALASCFLALTYNNLLLGLLARRLLLFSVRSRKEDGESMRASLEPLALDAACA